MEEQDANLRKIFVGGLHYNTTDASLRTYYEQFGELTEVILKMDQNTGRSRGFGFVSFQKPEMVDDCLAARPHVVDGKEVECKRAMPREGMQQALPELHVTSKKLFVGSLKEDINEEQMREYFSQFGKVASVEITLDKNTGQRRGFGFVTFDDYDPVDKAILVLNHEINGHQLTLKKALEREQREQLAAGVLPRTGGRGAAGGPGRGGPRGAPTRGRGMGRGVMAGVGGYYDPYAAPPAAYYGAAGYAADPYAAYDGYGSSAAYGYSDSYGYGAGYGGGAMKGPAYSQRATGPYGGGFGRGSGPSGGYGGAYGAGPAPGAYGAGGYGSYASGYGTR